MFYDKYIGVNLDDWCKYHQCTDRKQTKPYDRSYTVEMLGNVVGGKEVKYLNVDMIMF